MESILCSESGADVTQASGQPSWADPIWVEMFEYMEGQHITSCSSVDCDTK